MNNFRYLIPVLAATLLFVAACEKDPIDERMRQDEMIINNDLADLSKRVRVIEDGMLMPVYPVDFKGVATGLKSGQLPVHYEIYLRAEVDPPLSDGKTLQASHIKIVGNYAFVTYNYQGPEYRGGAEVYDVSDIRNPVLISEAIFPKMDISSIDIEPLGAGLNNFVFMTGASDPDIGELTLESAAVTERFIVNSANQFMHLPNPRQYYDMKSYAGNDVRYHSNMVYATSGSEGGLTILNNGMNKLNEIEIPWARSVDTDGSHLVVFSATEDGSRIYVMDMNGNVITVIEAGGEHFEDGLYLQAKSMVRLHNDLIFAAVGTGGMEVFDKSGSKLGSLPRPVEYLTADTPLNYVSNGVSVNENLVLVANGGSGVHIAEINEENQLTTLGKFMFEYGSSANFIEARDNKVFVATGKGGLKILEIVPIEPTEPCETLWDRIVELFPERGNIHLEDHPAHEISFEGLPGTIEITEDAPVYITFIHNGAGWHNSFGYYTYPAGSPPASPDDLELEIVYPYVNKYINGPNAGQDRVMGDRIRLGGNEQVFEAGTVIGFYIIAQGWDPAGNQYSANPKHVVYTTPGFNPEGVRKHVLFLEEQCNNIVLGFEDMLEGSDEDFNDIIFSISNGDDGWGNETNHAIDSEGLPEL